MLVFEFKVSGKKEQYAAIDEAIRTGQFIRNKCLRYWMDNRDVGRKELYRYCTQLRAEFGFVKDLYSNTCQAAVENAERAINRFYDNWQKKKPGKKGYPRFKKHSRSLEYKVGGWKLSECRKRITFTDKKGIGLLKLKGSRDLNFYQIEQIKRVRIVRRSDGYYVQFCIDSPRIDLGERPSANNVVGIDVGIKYFLADSDGGIVENPKFERKSEKQLNRANRKKSKKFKKGKPQSNNYKKARNRYARKHLRVSRQREEFVKSVALRYIQSNDLVACEDLNVKGMIKNRKLSKSISDAGWAKFRMWLEYFGKVYGTVTVAVPPQNTSQNCSNCGKKVSKSLSTRTHVCPHCGYVADRDTNAAINILKRAINTAGHAEINAWGELPSSLAGETPATVTATRRTKNPRPYRTGSVK